MDLDEPLSAPDVPRLYRRFRRSKDAVSAAAAACCT